MKAQLSDLGFKVQWIPMDEVERAGALVAEHPCPNRVNAASACCSSATWTPCLRRPVRSRPTVCKGNIGTGPGINDMKGGLVDMLFALKAMQAAGVLKQTEITIVLSGDEEAHGEPASISRRDMIAAAKHSDLALEFEGTPRVDGIFYGSISRRSSITWQIRTTGETGHSSGIFSQRIGLWRHLRAHADTGCIPSAVAGSELTYNVGMVVGGSSIHVDEARQQRHNYRQGQRRRSYGLRQRRHPHDLQPTVRAGGEKDAGHCRPASSQDRATINFGEGYPAMAPTAQSRALLGILNQANASLGFQTDARIGSR